VARERCVKEGEKRIVKEGRKVTGTRLIIGTIPAIE